LGDWKGHKILQALHVDLKALKEFILEVDEVSYRAHRQPVGNPGSQAELTDRRTALSSFSDASVRFENYCVDALHAVLIAHDEARKQGQNLVGTEHLLLGLLLEFTGKGGHVLRDLALEADFVRRSIARINSSDFGLTAVSIPYTVRARRVFELARAGAEFLNAPRVDSEHLLLSLLSDRSSMCWEILVQAGIDVEKLRKTLGDKYPEQIEDGAELLLVATVEEGDCWPLISLRFSKKLSSVIDASKQEACQRSGGVAGPEIVLLALLSAPDAAFSQCSIAPEIAYKKLSAIIKTTSSSGEFIVFTPPALKAMHSAFALSRFEGSAYVQSQHLMTALIRGADDQLQKLLMTIGISDKKIDKSQVGPSPLKIVGGTDLDAAVKFSDAAEAVMKLAIEEAKSMGHNFVGTEQVLLALIRQNDGLAAQALAESGLELSAARVETRRIIGTGAGFKGEFPYTPRTNRMLEMAVCEAHKAGHTIFDTEHLLLGILREGEGVAMRVLENLNVDLAELEKKLWQFIGNKTC